jgi:hypothetical protein
MEDLQDTIDQQAAEIEQLKLQVAKLTAALAAYSQERTRFAHSVPEYSGTYFIAGSSGDVDEHRLPEYIEVCPAYGADWTKLYARTTVKCSYAQEK